MIKFVSIDSSLANTGVAIGNIYSNNDIVIEKILLVETTKTKNKQVRASTDTIDRCRQTYKFIDKILKEEEPKIIFMETPSGSQSSAGMKSYGATCQLIASLEPIPIELSPTEVKVYSVGNKTASKSDMIKWAVNHYPQLNWFYHANKLQAKNEHMADAIAIAHAGVQNSQFKQLIKLIS